MFRIAFLHSFLAGVALSGVSTRTGPQTRWPSVSPFAAIGARYLRRYPAEADAARLRDLLMGAAAHASSVELRTVLANRVRTDFIERDVVLLDGWILARSEARICALATLAR